MIAQAKGANVISQTLVKRREPNGRLVSCMPMAKGGMAAHRRRHDDAAVSEAGV